MIPAASWRFNLPAHAGKSNEKASFAGPILGEGEVWKLALFFKLVTNKYERIPKTFRELALFCGFSCRTQRGFLRRRSLKLGSIGFVFLAIKAHKNLHKVLLLLILRQFSPPANRLCFLKLPDTTTESSEDTEVLEIGFVFQNCFAATKPPSYEFAHRLSFLPPAHLIA